MMTIPYARLSGMKHLNATLISMHILIKVTDILAQT